MPQMKIDSEARPASGGNLDTCTSMVSRGSAVALLSEIWREVLKLENIGSEDEFFELGGNSLTGMRMVARVRDTFAIDLPLRTLFENRRLRELAEAIEIAVKESRSSRS
jgi:hypothetical protein